MLVLKSRPRSRCFTQEVAQLRMFRSAKSSISLSSSSSSIPFGWIWNFFTSGDTPPRCKSFVNQIIRQQSLDSATHQHAWRKDSSRVLSSLPFHTQNPLPVEYFDPCRSGGPESTLQPSEAAGRSSGIRFENSISEFGDVSFLPAVLLHKSRLR